MEEERAERQRWNEKEQNKIMDSVRGLKLPFLQYYSIKVSISILGLANIRRRAIALKQQRLRMQQQQQEGGGAVKEVELGDPWEESDEVCANNGKGWTNLQIHCFH